MSRPAEPVAPAAAAPMRPVQPQRDLDAQEPYQESDATPTPALTPSVPRARFPTLPSHTGSLGLLHASVAEVGPVRHLRLGLYGEYFGANDFLIKGDADQRLAGGLVGGYTLLPNLEIFGAILNASNRNDRVHDFGDTDPKLIKTFGDLVLGGKWVVPLVPEANLGVELGLKFLSGVSNLALSPSSTSWWLGPLFSYDFRRQVEIPLRLHAGLSYYADNSSNLRDLSGTSITRNTKEAVMFGYGIAPSRLRMSLAADFPLEDLLPGVPIDPFLEYHMAYVTSSADRDFQDYMSPNCGLGDATSMPCVDNRDMHWVTIGARAAVYRGITVDLGIDIRVRSPGFPYGPPLQPWNLMFGVSYPLDLDSLTHTRIVTRTVEKAPRPTEGQLAGFVRNAKDGSPVGGAIIAATGRARARVASDPDGSFATVRLPAGPAELEVSAASFESNKLKATVVAGRVVDLGVTLVPSPPLVRVYGRVTDAVGKGVEASIKFAGDQIVETKADPAGSYSASLPVGSYRVRADGSGLPSKELQLDVVEGQDRHLDFALRPATSDVTVSIVGQAVRMKKVIRFVGATSNMTADTQKLLDAVVTLLEQHPEQKKVRIVAHWDNGLGDAEAAMLTQHQAEAVRVYLATHGIAEGRLAAVGAGSTKPLVPNLTPANRARNRRVDLLLE